MRRMPNRHILFFDWRLGANRQIVSVGRRSTGTANGLTDRRGRLGRRGRPGGMSREVPFSETGERVDRGGVSHATEGGKCPAIETTAEMYTICIHAPPLHDTSAAGHPDAAAAKAADGSGPGDLPRWRGPDRARA